MFIHYQKIIFGFFIEANIILLVPMYFNPSHNS